MAPTVILECSKGMRGHSSASAMTGKSQKLSRGYSSGFVPEYRHATETVGESEGLGVSGRVDSEDSCSPKRKSISLNVDRSDGFNVPLQVISMGKMSGAERKELETRLRAELEQVQALQKRLTSMAVMSASGVAVSSSSNGHVKKRDPVGQNAAAQLKRGVVGKFEPVKKAQPPPSVSNSETQLMKQCEQILKRLLSHQYSWVFNTPVDAVKLNIPDYYTVIKHPMDLGTIKTKLASGAYSSPRSFVADVRLTFTNAMTYNPPGNDVHIMADVLGKFFEARWKPIEKKLALANTRVKQETVPAKALLQSAPQSAPQSVPHSKKRKVPPMDHNVVMSEKTNPKMSAEDRKIVTQRLESIQNDVPDHIQKFLGRHFGTGANQVCEAELEVDLVSLSDDTMFELQRLMDDDMRKKRMGQQDKAEPCEMEIFNDYVLSNSSMHPCKVLHTGNEPADEDVDIGGNDPPISIYPPVEIDKDTAPRSSKCSSSSSSSSDSGSSSSDSDSGSSSGSDSDDRVASPTKAAKGNVGGEATVDQEKGNLLDSVDIIRSVSGLDHIEHDGDDKPAPVETDCQREGENAPSERQVSPEKLYRAALLRSRFADTILKAREKALDQSEKGDPEKLQREKEELEKRQREEKARLQAEAKAAEEARKRAEAEAAAEAAVEAKRKLELEREAARQALLKMEKTVEINENSLILKDLEMLHVPSLVDETNPDDSLDGIGGFKLGGANPLEQLGLYIIKVDDDEEEYAETSSVPANDVEEGEID